MRCSTMFFLSFFFVLSCFKLSAQVLQSSQPALHHCVTFENATILSAILRALEVLCEYEQHSTL